jgi:hypothetical protein
MDGGVCEATAYQAFGYASGGLALALGNYHNMGRARIGAEFVHTNDLVNLTKLLPAAVRRIATAASPLATVRANLRKRLPAARRELEATRSLPRARALRGALIAGFASAILAPGGAHAVLPPWTSEPEPVITTKPGAPLILLAQPARPAQDPREGYDALAYGIVLRIDPATERIAGRVEMTFRAETDLPTVVLDLHATLTADSALCDGEPCPVERLDDRSIEISLPGLLGLGDSATVSISYEGTPGPPYFNGFEFYSGHGQEPATFPAVASLSQPDRASGWWPCKDLMHDKAVVSLTVEAPEGFIVASNGTKLSEDSTGEGVRVSWSSAYPVSTYLVSFAATDYARWSGVFSAADGDSVALELYAYPEEEAQARIDYEVVPEALGIFESRFGPYPFRDRSIGWEKLGVAQFAWRSGAMEHQTCISYGEGFVTGDRRNDWALAHEISHQWWGDEVTPASMEDIWLNEGFATYCEALLQEGRTGAPGYRAWMLRIRAHPEVEYVGTVVAPVQLFGSTVYRKGAWFLHMLRGLLGEERFFEALNEYEDRHRYANATTADFLRAVEETARRTCAISSRRGSTGRAGPRSRGTGGSTPSPRGPTCASIWSRRRTSRPTRSGSPGTIRPPSSRFRSRSAPSLTGTARAGSPSCAGTAGVRSRSSISRSAPTAWRSTPINGCCAR